MTVLIQAWLGPEIPEVLADGAGGYLTKVQALFVAEREEAVHGWVVKELGHRCAGESGDAVLRLVLPE